jgi:hypothetical protein
LVSLWPRAFTARKEALPPRGLKAVPSDSALKTPEIRRAIQSKQQQPIGEQLLLKGCLAKYCLPVAN